MTEKNGMKFFGYWNNMPYSTLTDSFEELSKMSYQEVAYEVMKLIKRKLLST